VLLVLLVLPFVELAVFIAAVGWVGFLPALAGIVVLGVAGCWLVKRQGLGVWRRADGKLRAGEVPSAELVNGLLVLAAGLLLIFPGFVSDAVGLALLLPPVRAGVRVLLFKRFEQRVAATFSGPVGVTFGAQDPHLRINTGRATYGGPVDVREVAEAADVSEVDGREVGPRAPEAPGPGRP
jgi:UPF0716 protein FxsA